jgi:hypothetical protein
MSRIAIAILIYHLHKPIDRINLLGLQRRRNVFPVRYKLYPSYDLNRRQGDELSLEF